ncbi:MAG: uracil-DNA glycosylase, partial [Gammaproteobacteria bacterium]|nr:uracil-DNA glycosylase [Gammaproteobacteria bacterium]
MGGGTARRAQYLEALGIDRYVPRRPGAVPSADSSPPGISPPSPVAPQPAVLPPAMHAEWEALAAQVRACTRCGLQASRTQTVFGVGDRRAELLVVGEAPGADEDRQGEPFVGRAGQLLNSMLRAMRAPRETVYIANVLKCRPPGNRDPTPGEVRCCLPYLQRQIDLLSPRLMLAVGRIAAQNLLGTDTPIGKLRGTVHRFGTQGTPLIVTYHPAYLLRSPGEKRKSWLDLRFVRRELARLRAQAR